MEDTNVPPEVSNFGVIAADLRRVADLFDKVADVELRESPYVRLSIQPDGTDEQIIERTDAVGLALFGRSGAVREMGTGDHHYDVEGAVGAVTVHLYDRLSDGFAQARKYAERLATKEAELERLRVEVEQLRGAADPSGLTHSRTDGDQDPQPSGGRVDARYVDVFETVHMGYAAGGTVCGTSGERSLVWSDVTCQACVDKGRF